MEKILFNAQIIVLVLLVLLVSYTIHYIRELKNCVCFQSNDKYKVNLEFLEFYQYLELLSILFIFLGLFSFNNSVRKYFGVGGKAKSNKFLLSLVLVIILGVHFFIQYNVMINVFNLSTNIKSDCECATKWQRFFLYYQGITSGIEVVHYVIALLTIVILLFSALIHNM